MSTDTTTPTETPVSTGRSRRGLIVMAAGLVILLGGAGYMFLGVGGAEPDADVAEPADGSIVEVGVLTTNLSGPTARYARVGVALVLHPDADPAAVAARFPLVKDAVIDEIGRHEPAALQGADGGALLRAALTQRVQGVFPDGEILRVVLTELLVQ